MSTFQIGKTLTGRLWGERKSQKFTGNFGGVEGYEENLRWGTICDDGFNEVVGQSVCE